MSNTGIGDARFLLMVICAFLMGVAGTVASAVFLHVG